MNATAKDAKIKKAETILKANKVLFVVYVALAITGAFIFAILGIAYQSWELGSKAIYLLLSIIFVWFFKQLVDGFGLIVYNSALSLHEQGVTTLLDIEQMEAEKKEEKNNSVLSESIEERLKKDFGNKKEDE